MEHIEVNCVTKFSMETGPVGTVDQNSVTKREIREWLGSVPEGARIYLSGDWIRNRATGLEARWVEYR